jgi:hypothetical protein
MKKIIYTLLLVKSLLSAETVFSLDEQYFSENNGTTAKLSTYDLVKTQVTTNLIVRNGSYTYDKTGGYFKVKLKKPLDEWGVNVSAFYVMATHEKRNRSIVLISGTDTISLNFKNEKISYDGEIICSGEKLQNYSINIKRDKKNRVVIKTGCAKPKIIENIDFEKLEEVEVQITAESFNMVAYQDKLLNLVIAGK